MQNAAAWQRPGTGDVHEAPGHLSVFGSNDQRDKPSGPLSCSRFLSLMRLVCNVILEGSKQRPVVEFF
jgi:hypothetical protein